MVQRMESVAPPGGVMLSASTAQLVLISDLASRRWSSIRVPRRRPAHRLWHSAARSAGRPAESNLGCRRVGSSPRWKPCGRTSFQLAHRFHRNRFRRWRRPISRESRRLYGQDLLRHVGNRSLIRRAWVTHCPRDDPQEVDLLEPREKRLARRNLSHTPTMDVSSGLAGLAIGALLGLILTVLFEDTLKARLSVVAAWLRRKRLRGTIAGLDQHFSAGHIANADADTRRRR